MSLVGIIATHFAGRTRTKRGTTAGRRPDTASRDNESVPSSARGSADADVVDAGFDQVSCAAVLRDDQDLHALAGPWRHRDARRRPCRVHIPGGPELLEHEHPPGRIVVLDI